MLTSLMEGQGDTLLHSALVPELLSGIQEESGPGMNWRLVYEEDFIEWQN